MHPALADATPVPFWLDSDRRPSPLPPLTAATQADLVVVGGGFTGLWTALLAKQRNPSTDVLLLESHEIGWAASGRNGGFAAASLTHGIGNGRDRFPGEVPELERLGAANLAAIAATIEEFGIDCDLRRSGELSVATAEHQLEWLAEEVAAARELGRDAELLDATAARAELNSPTYLGAAWDRSSTMMLDPARLAWGLKRACLRSGVRIAEGTPVAGIARDGGGVRLRTGEQGGGVAVRAARVALGTNVFPSLLRRLRAYVVPVYDYVLVTEPLSARQLAEVGWANRQGVGDVSNQFHYYRRTADDRILWGGYDAIYHFGSSLAPRHDQRPATFELLARQFFETFPQLAGLRFTHAWGGAIDTCTRFFAFQGTALGGRVAYSLGYTGLGVAATRFGAEVMLDLLDGSDSPALRLEAVRRRPLPFPPEPVRYAGIQLTRRALAKADRDNGRRGPWLRTLDRLGLGFDS